MSIAEKLTAIAENEQRVYDAGKNAGAVEWMKNFLQNGKRTVYTFGFYGVGWNDENYGVIAQATDQINATGASTQMFAASYITDTLVPINIASSSRTNKTKTFDSATKLERVALFIINETQSMDAQFTSCEKLKHLTIEGTIARNANFQWCPLTPESMKSVILHLKDFTGTGNEYSTTVNFTDACWAALEADSTAPDGGTWKDYVSYTLCWNA